MPRQRFFRANPCLPEVTTNQTLEYYMTTQEKTQQLTVALDILRRASKLAALSFDEHVAVERAYVMLSKEINPPSTISAADEEAARV